MFKKVVFLAIFFLYIPLWPQSKWTLQQCLEYARQHNINIRLAEENLESSRIEYKNSKEKFLPSLNFGTSASWNYGLTQNLTTGVLENQTVFGNSLRFSADIPVFQGFFLQNNKQNAYLSRLLAEYNLKNQIKSTEINIVNAYLQILMNHEAVKAMEAQWKSGLEQIKKMQELVRSGLRPESDLKDLEAQSANDYYNYVRLKNVLKLSKINLATLLELDNIENFEIETKLSSFPVHEELLMKNPSELFESKKIEIPEYQLAETRLKLADKQIALAKSGLYPSISFFLSWNSRYMNREKITGVEIDPDNPVRVIGITENSHENVIAPNFIRVLGPPDPYFTQIQDNQGAVFGFSLNIPLFNRFQVRRNIQKALIERKKAELNLKSENLRIKNNILKLHADVLNAQAKMQAAEKNIKAAQTALSFAIEKLNAGLISSYELENIRSRKIRAQTDYISSKYEYLLKLKLLEISLQSYD